MIFFKVKTEFIYNKMETFFIFTFFLGKNKWQNPFRIILPMNWFFDKNQNI